MALSYIAQAIVVTIVGLNMGFRFVRTLHERERGEVGVRFGLVWRSRENEEVCL
jgi:hypothetical protein